MLGFLKFLGGREIGAFTKGLVGKGFDAFKKTTGTRFTAHNAMNALKMQLYVGVPLTLISSGTPEEKMQGLLLNLGTGFMTMGMNSPWRQFGWSTAITLSPHYGSAMRGVVQGYRSALESRTSMAVPFSHSNLAMDQAFASLQYSRARLSDAYQNVGSEAAFFAARYTSRG